MRRKMKKKMKRSPHIVAHFLTVHGVNCMNRGDHGRPKTVNFGGTTRQRKSAQAKGRALRESPNFRHHAGGHEIRSRKFPMDRIYLPLVEQGYKEEWAIEAALHVTAAGVGKRKREKITASKCKAIAEMADEAKKKAINYHKTTIPYGDLEVERADNLVKTLLRENRRIREGEGEIFSSVPGGCIVSAFGRMLAGDNDFGVESAVSLNHGFTVNASEPEVDFFTTVDDLASPDEAVSSHLGRFEFGSGIIYDYASIDRNLLSRNMGDNEEAVQAAIKGLVHGFATTTPTGKNKKMNADAFAYYIRIEKTHGQPRTLADAFLDPIEGPNMKQKAVQALRDCARDYERAYDIGPKIKVMEMLVHTGEVKLSQLLEFAAAPFDDDDDDE